MFLTFLSSFLPWLLVRFSFIPVSLCNMFCASYRMAGSFFNLFHFSHSVCFCRCVLLWSLTLVAPFFLCFTKKHPVSFTFPLLLKQFLICPFFLLLTPWECNPVLPSMGFFVCSLTSSFFFSSLCIQVKWLLGLQVPVLYTGVLAVWTQKRAFWS